MALESWSLRRVISLLPGLFMAALLAGCDRQNPPAPQGNGTNAVTPAAAPAAPGGAAPAAGNETAHADYPTGRLDRSHAGTAAPALAFQGPDGQPTRLAAFRGRPLLVNFWATWCGPCIVEMPSLDGLAGRQGGDRGLRIVAISQDSTDGRRKVTDFFAAHRFQHLQPYLDSEMGLMFALGLDTLPTTILFDSQGREVWRMVGMADWQSARVARLLLEADAG
jgi:thiol-disulfide isomerase/thioredoxin